MEKIKKRYEAFGESKFMDGAYKSVATMNLSTRILVGFLVIGLLIVVVGISVYSIIGNIVSKKIPLIVELNDLKGSIMMMGKAEKDFLIIDQKSTAYFTSGKSENIEAFNKAYGEAKESYEKLLKDNFIKSDETMDKELQEVGKSLDSYYKNFSEVTVLLKDRGDETIGKVGEMVKGLQMIEVEINKIDRPDIRVSYLTLRDYQTSLLTTNDEKFFTRMINQIGDLKMATTQDGGDLGHSLELYYAKVNQLKSTNAKIFHPKYGMIVDYREKSKQLDEILGKSYDSIQKRIKDEIAIQQLMVIVAIAVTALFALFVAMIITRTIIRPINDTQLQIKDIAEGEGDLTYRFDVNGNNEMDQMKASINTFITKIRQIIIGVKQTAITLSLSSGELAKAIEEANSNIERISTEVVDITKDLDSTNTSVDHIIGNVADLSSLSHMIADENQSITLSATGALAAAQRGQRSIGDVVSSIDSVKSESNNVVRTINELSTFSQEIGSIIGMITSISEQTNLLALNASIEAARAGDAGRGFGVVAQEIRKLAEDSKTSTVKISKLIQEIENRIHKAGEIIKNESRLVEASVNQSSVAAQDFSSILDSIGEVNHKSSAIVELIEKQRMMTEQIGVAVDSISKLAQNNVNGASSISESIENQVSIFEEIGASIEELSSMSDLLRAETEKFRTDRDGFIESEYLSAGAEDSKKTEPEKIIETQFIYITEHSDGNHEPELPSLEQGSIEVDYMDLEWPEEDLMGLEKNQIALEEEIVTDVEEIIDEKVQVNENAEPIDPVENVDDKV